MFHCRQTNVLTLGVAPELIRNGNVKMVSVPLTFKVKKKKFQNKYDCKDFQ